MMDRTEKEWEHVFLDGDVAGTLYSRWGVPFAAGNAIVTALRSRCSTCEGRTFVRTDEWADGHSYERVQVRCEACVGTGWALPVETS